MTPPVTARQIASALARPEVQSLITRWRGAKFVVRELSCHDRRGFFASGDLVFMDGTTESQTIAGAPTVEELALGLPSAMNVAAARAALEQEIGRDLRRVKGQIDRATRKPDLRRAAELRSSWARVENDLRRLLELEPYEVVSEQVNDLVNRLAVAEVMHS